ncbi:asparagine synthase-related protein [Halobacterium bonnevillei]|uniref:Asparagine synthetase domain-containing protein n=1 Tax=Halobacterium bonnevillei TaxID=2692200 RepID=A0A6B0SJ97_9EURY|nr:asparagine synthase-related protein [Halobacterium bonnevillei]MXR19583.1 hypothetical protein [Halobacterium bonnevillei]
MTEVRTLFTDPKTVAFEGAYGTWLVSGVATNRIRDLVVNADGLRAVRDELAAQVEDAIVVFVSATDEGGRLAAFRSVTSSRDVFYLEASDGTIVLTDHYRNAVSQLDPADRTVDRNAVVDHLLFGSPVEPSTFVVEIGRLGRGECMHWNGVDREWTRTLVDRLDTVERYSQREAVGELDDALANVVRVGVRPDARSMLSGGVDSTLLASYRRDSPRPVQVTVDAPEYQPGVDAGREAADLLDASRDVVSLSGSAFLDYLESTVDALGLPPRYKQTVLVSAGLQSLDPGQYVDGQGSDPLFGLPGVKAARIADWTAPLLESSVVSRAADAAPGDVTDVYDALATRRRQLARPVANPKSFAQTLAADVDPDAVAEIFDPQVVRDRARRRVEYAAERARWTRSRRSRDRQRPGTSWSFSPTTRRIGGGSSDSGGGRTSSRRSARDGSREPQSRSRPSGDTCRGSVPWARSRRSTSRRRCCRGASRSSAVHGKPATVRSP